MRTKWYMASFKGNETELMTDGNGFIMSHDDWESLKKVMDNIYDNHSPEQVDAHNEYVTSKLKEEYSAVINRARKKEKKERPGHVYFISYSNRHIKIGYSTNIKSRFKQLQVASPEELNLLLAIPSKEPSVLEKEIHELLVEKKVRGEWYSLTLTDIDRLRGAYCE